MKTGPVLLAIAGGEPFDETFICQHAEADRWTEEVSEKAGSGSQGDRLSGPGKGRLGANGNISEKQLCSVGSTGGKRVYPRGYREAKKLISF